MPTEENQVKRKSLKINFRPAGIFVAGCLLGLYLLFISFLGDLILIKALFISFWGLLYFFCPIAYGIYALIGYKRQRKVGLQLIKFHYAVAIIISFLGIIFRDNEIDQIVKEAHAMADQPLGFFLVFGPFLLANAWYLWRLLSTPIERVDRASR